MYPTLSEEATQVAVSLVPMPPVSELRQRLQDRIAARKAAIESAGADQEKDQRALEEFGRLEDQPQGQGTVVG